MPPTPLHQHWGQRLREHRIAAEMTPTQLARLCGVSRQALWNYETAKRVVPDTMRVAFAKALGTTVPELFPHDLADAA